MFRVQIKTDSHYRVNRQKIRAFIFQFFREKKIKGKIEVSLNIVGDRKMKALNRKYRGEDETTDVLSFPLAETKGNIPFIEAPDGVLRLGDIVISYPQAVLEAAEENVLVEEKIAELLRHGLEHLLGNHHD